MKIYFYCAQFFVYLIIKYSISEKHFHISLIPRQLSLFTNTSSKSRSNLDSSLGSLFSLVPPRFEPRPPPCFVANINCFFSPHKYKWCCHKYKPCFVTNINCNFWYFDIHLQRAARAIHLTGATAFLPEKILIGFQSGANLLKADCKKRNVRNSVCCLWDFGLPRKECSLGAKRENSGFDPFWLIVD